MNQNKNSQLQSPLLRKQASRLKSAVPNEPLNLKQADNPRQQEEGLSLTNFLKNQTFSIDLTQIYKIHSTCAYHEGMEYCPVLVKVMDEGLQKEMKAKYLLQIWKKGGEQIHEIPFQDEPQILTTTYDHCIYQPSKSDEKPDDIHIYYYPKEDDKQQTKQQTKQQKKEPEPPKDFNVQSSIFAKDKQPFNIKYITYWEELQKQDKASSLRNESQQSNIRILFVANKKQIMFAFLNEDGSKIAGTNVISIDVSKNNAAIYGLFLTNFNTKDIEKMDQSDPKVMVALETQGGYIEFNFLKVDKESYGLDSKKMQYEFYQQAEQWNGPDSKNERIEKFKFLVVIDKKNGEPAIVATTLTRNKTIRDRNGQASIQNGNFNLYYQGSLVSTSKKGKLHNNCQLIILWLEQWEDIWLTFEGFQIAFKEQKSQETQFRTIDITHGNEVSFLKAEPVQKSLSNDYINQELVKRYCNLFGKFLMVGNTLYVAYYKNLSSFDTDATTQAWQHHKLSCNKKIINIYKNTIIKKQEPKDPKEEQKEQNDNIIVLFGDHPYLEVIEKIEKNDYNAIENEKQNINEETQKFVNKIRNQKNLQKIAIYQDKVLKKYSLVVVEYKQQDETLYKFFAICNNQMSEINNQIEVDQYIQKPTIVFLQSNNPDQIEFLIQYIEGIQIFQISDSLSEVQQAKKAEGTIISEEDQKNIMDKGISIKIRLIAKIDKTFKCNGEEVGILKSSQGANEVQEGIKYVIPSRQEFIMMNSTREMIEEEKGDRVVLLLKDKTKFYKIDMTYRTIQIMENQQSNCWFVSDQKYLYSLNMKTDKIQAGLNLYDLKNLVEHNKEFILHFNQYIMVGSQNLIDFNFENQRIIYQQSVESIEVIPLVHKNTISFIALEQRDKYLAGRQIENKFVALSTNGELHSWDLHQGKHIRSEKKYLQKQNEELKSFDKYEIYQTQDPSTKKYDFIYKREWSSRILLKRKEKCQVDKDNSHNQPNPNQEQQKEDILEKHQKRYGFQNEYETFKFILIEIESEHSVKELCSFQFSICKEISQQLFFSEDLNTMYERIKVPNGREKHQLYRRKANANSQSEVKWELLRQFFKLPQDLLEFTEYPFIFSPNFDKHLDFNEETNQFCIKIYNQEVKQEEEEVYDIPTDYMNATPETRKEIANRFQWVNQDKIYIVNDEGIEMILEIAIKKAQIDKQIQKVATFHLKAYNFIPLYDREICKSRHLLYEGKEFEKDDLVSIFQSKYQKYKTAYFMTQGYLADKTIPDAKIKEQCNKQIFNLNYKSQNCQGHFEVQMSFTILHWGIIDQLISGQFALSDLNDDLVKELFYVILPGGQTILHQVIMAQSEQSTIQVSKTSQKKVHNITKEGIKLFEELLRKAHSNPNDPSSMTTIHLPCLQNFDKKSPLALILQNANGLALGNQFLKCLESYEMNHHSRDIANCLSQIIMVKPTQSDKEEEQPNPQFKSYFLTRIKQTERIQGITRGIINQGLSTALILNKQAEEILFEKDDQSVEVDVNLQYIDIPDIHNMNSEDSTVGKTFLKYLSELNDEDIGLFKEEPIKKIIEYQWKMIFNYMIYWIFVPNVILLLSFSMYIHTHWIKEAHSNSNTASQESLIMVILCCSMLLLYNEINQLKHNGLSYFQEIWNWFDLSALILAILFVISDFFDILSTEEDRTTRGIIQGTISLLLWLKFLYFLRIFSGTGYYIRILFVVCYDVRYFLLLLIFTFIAFGEAFQSISDIAEDGGFTGYLGGISYVYRMVLGDFSVDDFNNNAPLFLWIIFIASTIINMIIMLNLLIAIISDSFTKINEKSEQASYREKAGIIAENKYLISKSDFDKLKYPNNYFLMALKPSDGAQEQSATEITK